MEFKSREELRNNKDESYQGSLLEQLQSAIKDTDPSEWKDEPNTIINQVEKQGEYFWIRIHLKNEEDTLKVGDNITMYYKPANEKLEMSFGAYEKVGLNKDHNDEVVNYVDDDDKKILCCMIDLYMINKDSDHISTIRTFFRNSRYYEENLLRKDDIVISSGDKVLEYTYISF